MGSRGVTWCCKAVAAHMLESAQKGVRDLQRRGITPSVTLVQVGESPASVVYNEQKTKTCMSVGIRSSSVVLPENASMHRLLEEIDKLNRDPTVHGVLVQLPLPDHLDREDIFSAIDPHKDVDGFHPVNAGHMVLGQDGLFPCTPLGIMHLIMETKIRPCHTVVVGRSNVVGNPMAQLLLRANFTPTIIHTGSENAQEIARSADLLIVAAGHPGLVDSDWVKPGASVIDVGITQIDSEQELEKVVSREHKSKWNSFHRHGRVLVGDVRYHEVLEVASRVTQVPGGVGRLTSAQLMLNCVKAAALQWKDETGM